MQTSITLDTRQLNELELLLDGSYHPLKGYMNRKDYNSCLHNMRLEDGTLWAIPITFAISKNISLTLSINDVLILKDMTGISIAELNVEDIFEPDINNEFVMVLGSMDSNHPYHNIIMNNKEMMYVGGTVRKLNNIIHYDFKEHRLTPSETKKYFQENGWTKIIGFQTRNPLHRSHYMLTLNCIEKVGADCKLLLHPVVGLTQDCDIDYHARVRCYKKLLTKYDPNTVLMSLLPLNMRMAGPREAMHHAIIRKNYGCTHFIVGRDHAGPSYKTKDSKSFYGPYDAHKLLLEHEDELGIKFVLSENIVYVKEIEQFMEESRVPNNMSICNLSGTEQRNLLANNMPIPNWFSWDDIVEELRKEYRLQQKKGLCIYLIGLSGSGKSTMANIIMNRMKENETERKITILDGDVVRLNLSKGLGFSKMDRSTNVRRIGYVASEIVKHCGIVICANIAPYEEDRQYNRKLISQYGKYIEVFVNTSLECCEKRDVKGLYKKAREGLKNGIQMNMTGIDDIFEIPNNSEIVINGEEEMEKNCNIIFDYLQKY
jgi:sulfate adenylyltransferase